jgi:uncharacterized membrane protein
LAEVIKLAPAVEEAFKAFPGASEGEKRICNRYYPAISKRARNEERAAAEKQIAEITATHAGMIDGIKQAQRDELTRHDAHAERLRRAHGWAMFFNGGLTFTAVAGVIVAVGLAWYTQAIMVPTFDAARESRVQDDVLRTLQERPPTTNEPRSESAP